MKDLHVKAGPGDSGANEGSLLFMFYGSMCKLAEGSYSLVDPRKPKHLTKIGRVRQAESELRRKPGSLATPLPQVRFYSGSVHRAAPPRFGHHVRTPRCRSSQPSFYPLHTRDERTEIVASAAGHPP